LLAARWQTRGRFLCDAHMVSPEGDHTARTFDRFCAADNQIICHPARPACAGHGGKQMGNTRSAAASGTVAAAIWRGLWWPSGNEPTAPVSPCCNMLEDPDCRALPPSSGCPRGVCRWRLESKDALMQDLPVPSMDCAGAFGRFCDYKWRR